MISKKTIAGITGAAVVAIGAATAIPHQQRVVGIVATTPNVTMAAQVIAQTKGDVIYYAITRGVNAQVDGMIEQLPNSQGIIIEGAPSNAEATAKLNAYLAGQGVLVDQIYKI